MDTTALQEYSNWTFSLSLMSWTEVSALTHENVHKNANLLSHLIIIIKRLDKQPSGQLTGSRLNNNNNRL